MLLNHTQQKNIPPSGEIVSHQHLRWHILKAKHVLGFFTSSLKKTSLNSILKIQVFLNVIKIMVNLFISF
jgi:hypothetical protein